VISGSILTKMLFGGDGNFKVVSIELCFKILDLDTVLFTDRLKGFSV
jgi:hypothetical protein